MGYFRSIRLPRPHLTARMAAPGDALAIAGVMVIAVIALALPVAWNGFVLVYHDSIDYLGLTFTWQMPEFRTAAYGLFAGIGRLAGSPTAIVLAQSALVVLTIALCVRAQFAPPRFLMAFTVAMIAALAGGISLFASQVMADVFAGAMVLGLVSLMLFFDGLSMPRRMLLAALCAVGVAVHTSHVGLALGLLMLGGMARLARRRWPGVPQVRLREAAFAAIGGISLAVTANAYVTGRPFLAQTATVQALALFIEGGVTKSYLDENCPPAGSHKPAPYKLCAYRDHLPPTANDFLWARGASPLYKLGGWDALRGEAAAIVDGSLETMPDQVVRQTLDLTAIQFLMLDPGDGLGPRWNYYVQTIGKWYPGSAKAFQGSRQQHGIDFKPLYWPTRAIMGVSLAALLIFALAWRRAPRQAMFAAAILAALVGNAFICGALSNPNHRYQGRLVWLVASSAAMMVLAQTSFGRVREREGTAPALG